MTTVLFAFVGSVRYHETTYSISQISGYKKKCRFLPHALVSGLGENPKTKIDRVVLLGTQTSGWAPLLRALDGSVGDVERQALPEFPRTITHQELRQLESSYTAAFGVETRAEVIPFAINPHEQQAFVSLLARHVEKRDAVHFDVTHGLRHLPLLALIGALALRKLVDAEIRGIWYGAWELRGQAANQREDLNSEETPVIRLDGLLSIADWLSAISVFDATAEVDAFAEPLTLEGFNSTATRLKDAVFHERIMGTRNAIGAIRMASEALDTVTSSPGLNLVRPIIDDRLAWALKDNDDDLGFFHAASFIKSGNEVKAFTIAYETALRKLARHCQHSITAADLPRLVSKACKKAMRANSNSSAAFARSYIELKNIRHKIVHLDMREFGRFPELSSPQLMLQSFNQNVKILKQPIPDDLIVLLNGVAP